VIRLLVSSTLCAAMALPAVAATPRYAITTDRIAAALANFGITVSPDQVTLLSSVVANTAEPQLKVRSVEPSGTQRVLARLECADNNQCLPFFVMVQLSAAAPPVPSQVNRPVPSGDAAHPVSSALIVHSGSMVTLHLESGPVHISIPVTCLESGASGETIRAMDKSNRQVYRAQIVSKDALRGSF
jgi:hypothetical protein